MFSVTLQLGRVMEAECARCLVLEVVDTVKLSAIGASLKIPMNELPKFNYPKCRTLREQEILIYYYEVNYPTVFSIFPMLFDLPLDFVDARELMYFRLDLEELKCSTITIKLWQSTVKFSIQTEPNAHRAKASKIIYCGSDSESDSDDDYIDRPLHDDDFALGQDDEAYAFYEQWEEAQEAQRNARIAVDSEVQDVVQQEKLAIFSQQQPDSGKIYTVPLAPGKIFHHHSSALKCAWWRGEEPYYPLEYKNCVSATFAVHEVAAGPLIGSRATHIGLFKRYNRVHVYVDTKIIEDEWVFRLVRLQGEPKKVREIIGLIRGYVKRVYTGLLKAPSIPQPTFGDGGFAHRYPDIYLHTFGDQYLLPDIPPQCSFCKREGHMYEDCEDEKNSFAQKSVPLKEQTQAERDLIASIEYALGCLHYFHLQHLWVYVGRALIKKFPNFRDFSKEEASRAVNWIRDNCLPPYEWLPDEEPVRKDKKKVLVIR